MSGHTKEPWSFGEGYAGTGMVVRSTGAKAPIAIGLSTSDAIRIVACVNACAGMTTEEVENDIAIGGYQDIVACHQAHIADVEKQRDELLAALEEIATHSVCCDARHIADKAIASVKGGA